jgi:hypothetical protein
MSDFKHLNLKEDVEDLAPKHGLAPNIESRFARVPLGLEQSGLSYYKMAPGFRLPFGHRHGEQEEIYVVLSGSARFKVDDDIVEMKALDVLRVPGRRPAAWRPDPRARRSWPSEHPTPTTRTPRWCPISGPTEARRYFSNRDRRRSFRTLPPVCSSGQ